MSPRQVLRKYVSQRKKEGIQEGDVNIAFSSPNIPPPPQRGSHLN